MVLGAGKASLRIAVALEAMLGDCIDAGLVVVPRGQGGRLERIEVLEADHPLPSADSVTAARRLMALAGTARPGDLVICCFTGGSSALASLPPTASTSSTSARSTACCCRAAPRSPRSTACASTCRASRAAVWRSRWRGATILNLTVSDVAGDPLDAITDPTVPDTTTVADAIAVLERHGLWNRGAGAGARAPGRRGPGGVARRWTPRHIDTLMLVSGELACGRWPTRATQRGFSPVVLVDQHRGREPRGRRTLVVAGPRVAHPRPALPAAVHAGRLRRRDHRHRDERRPSSARAARTRRPRSAAALRLKPGERIVAAFVDTDGADGGTDAAGAMVDGTTRRTRAAAGVDLRAAILGHTSRRRAAAVGELLVTGPTGTNVNDMFAIAVDLAEEP